MARRVFVTGGSGFVGTAFIEELVSRRIEVAALSHSRPLAAQELVHPVNANLFDSPSLAKVMGGCDAVIHLVGIIMEKPRKGITFARMHPEATRSVVDAARQAGIRRFLHMSALGTRPDAVSNYHKTKFGAERYLRSSGLDWTIFRPSFIHGPRGEFMHMLAEWARRKAPPFLFMPYFGKGVLGRGGAGKLQPVYVKDVARAFVDALENPKTIGEVYPLGGPEQLTWPQLYHIASETIVGKRRLVAPIPVWYAKLLTRLFPSPLLPFNRDQVIMSQEDNTADLTKFKDAFGWEPAAFEPTLKSYAAQL